MSAGPEEAAQNAPAAPRTPAQRLLVAARFALAALIVAALFWYEILDVRELGRVLADPAASGPSLALLVAAFALGGVRWFLLLRGIGVALRFRRVFEIYAIGAFFNTFLPGGTGGDVVRVLYIVRSVREGRLNGAASVLADRVVGLYGMLLVAVALIAANAGTVYGNAATAVLATALAAFFAALTVGGAGLLLVARPLQRWTLARRWGGRSRLYRAAYRIAELMVLFRSALPTILAAAAMSVVMSSLIVASIVTLAHGHGFGVLGLLDYACAAVLGLLAGSIPVTPGGIGVAEGAFAYICSQWAGAGSGVGFGNIFLGFRLMLMGVSLLGAIALVTHRRG